MTASFMAKFNHQTQIDLVKSCDCFGVKLCVTWKMHNILCVMSTSLYFISISLKCCLAATYTLCAHHIRFCTLFFFFSRKLTVTFCHSGSSEYGTTSVFLDALLPSCCHFLSHLSSWHDIPSVSCVSSTLWLTQAAIQCTIRYTLHVTQTLN